MSKKRTSPGSSNHEQTDEGSDLVFQQDENAKRAKLTTLSDTTLQDLPMELIECILVKAVTMEVKDMHLAKSVWKEKADPVISRLSTVCPQWNNILTTNFFRNELQRNFAAEKTIRLEVLHQSRFEVFNCVTFTLMKDELFMLCEPEDERYYTIRVYDRNNMKKVKDVIPLPEIEPEDIAACSVSNCLYILNNKPRHLSVVSITKTDEHQFHVTTLINGLRRRNDKLSVAANGNLFLLWQSNGQKRAVISVYGPNGSLQHETRLSSDAYQSYYNIIPKSNGNFVLASFNERYRTKLTEIDMNGTILRQYQSSLFANDAVCHADKYGRIMIAEGPNEIELLDSEFNLLEFTGPQQDDDRDIFFCGTHYNRERNEVVSVLDLEDLGLEDLGLLIFHFTEE